jgi:TIR domain
MTDWDGGHAFLSYVHEDGTSVDRVQRILEGAGVKVWRDKDDLFPGEDWRARIRNAIRTDALAFIACFSQSFLDKPSSHMNEELLLAVEELRKRPAGTAWLIPVRFDDCQLPDIEIGPGRTLDSLQRVDLIDPGWENIGRLVRGVLRIAGMSEASQQIEASSTPITDGSNLSDSEIVVLLKRLMPYNERDIEVEDLMASLLERTRSLLGDRAHFPLSVAPGESRLSLDRLIVSQADEYVRAVSPLASGLMAGAAWGGTGLLPVWRRTMQALARAQVAFPDGGGLGTLIALRRFPLLVTEYSAGLAALYRGNYRALYEVTVAPEAKQLPHEQSLPVLSLTQTWAPFEDAEIAAQVLAFEADGSTLDDSEVESLRSGKKGKRYTPISDFLHARLRPLLLPVIPDDEEFTDTFDTLEVTLGVVAEDLALQAKAAGRFAYGGSIGSYNWRRRHGQHSFSAEVWQRVGGALLDAGFFGSDSVRQAAAWLQFRAREDEVAKHRPF